MNAIKFLTCLLLMLSHETAFAGSLKENIAKAEKLRNQADNYYKSDNYQKALTLLQQAYDTSGEAKDRYNMGNCYLALGNYSQALEMYELYIRELEIYEELLLVSKNEFNDLIWLLQTSELQNTDQNKANSLLNRIEALAKKAENSSDTSASKLSLKNPSPIKSYIKTNSRKLLIIPGGILLGISGFYIISARQLHKEEIDNGSTNNNNVAKINETYKKSIISFLPVIPLFTLALHKKRPITSVSSAVSPSKFSVSIFF